MNINNLRRWMVCLKDSATKPAIYDGIPCVVDRSFLLGVDDAAREKQRPFGRKSSFLVNFPMIFSVLCLSLSVYAPMAKGAVIVTFGTSVPDPILPGSSGHVDVFIRSSLPLGELLDGFQVGLTIAPGGASPGAAGGLVFSAAQTDAQLTIAAYVLFGNSFDLNTPVGVGTVTGGGAGYIGADITNDFIPVTLPNTNKLLYRMNLSAVSSGTYTIGVNAGVTSFFRNQLDPVGTAISFSSVSGNISTVPEPASTAFLLVTLVGVGLRRRRR